MCINVQFISCLLPRILSVTHNAQSLPQGCEFSRAAKQCQMYRFERNPCTDTVMQEKNGHVSVPNVLKVALKMDLKTNEQNGLI